MRKKGFDYSGIRYGHGLGLTIAEGFDMSERDTTPIPEGAHGVIHPLVIKADTGSCAIWGDPWILRVGGPEMLV